MKKAAALWLSLLLSLLVPLCSFAEVQSLPQEGEAPWPPVESAYSEDFLSYDDGTLSIHIEKDVVGETNVFYVYVKLTDVSQFRTALADWSHSKATRPVWSMAKQNNAVLAINGDYYSYQNTGIVVRSGKIIRQKPVSTRDTLVIDGNGDFQFLTQNTQQEWKDFLNSGVEIREAFSFGPALITDGQEIQFKYREKTSCGYPTPAQRMVLCQMGHLEYMIFACEGPEQNKKAGLSIPEVIPLLLARGVQKAYNMDGGTSATVMMGTTRINAPDSKYRNVSDIIYFATLVSPENEGE